MAFRFSNRLGRSSQQPSYSHLIAQRADPDLARAALVVRPGRRRSTILLLGALAAVLLVGIVLLVWLYTAGGRDGAAEQEVAVVTANRLNCRAQPSPGADVVYVAMRTQQLTVIGEQSAWRRVRVAGNECWVSGEFLAVTPVR